MALVLDLLRGLAERYRNGRTCRRSRTSRLIARAASAAACVAAAALCVVAVLPQRTDGLVLYQKATLVVHQGEVLLAVASKKPGSYQTYEREAHD